MEMHEQIKKFENLLHNVGGYVVVPKKRRNLSVLIDDDSYKITTIKSIVWVCESRWNDEYDVRIKVIDEDDEMWDMVECLQEDQIQYLYESIIKK